MAAININHTEGSITTDNDRILQITKNGAIKIGNGSFLNEANLENEDYSGSIRYNELTKNLEYHDGKNWKAFSYGIDETPGIIWSLTF